MNRQTRGRRKASRKTLRRQGKTPELHCMLIPAEQSMLLLPTSVMEEVVDYTEPRSMDAAPPWLLGSIEWDDRQVPVFSFDALLNGGKAADAGEHSRIMVLKSLTDSGRVPYLGVLLSDLPHPITVKPTDLEETGDEKKSLGVFQRVSVGENEAIIPDLDRLTHLVTHAAYGALPITQLEP